MFCLALILAPTLQAIRKFVSGQTAAEMNTV
jgi:hypothetical protein